MPDQAGWYPDPARPDHARWHDGTSWTPHVRLGTPPPVAAQPPAPMPPVPAEPSMFARSVWSTFSLLLAGLYLIAFFFGNVFVFGLTPLALAIAGYKRHEPIAVPALVVGVVVLGLNLYISISS